MNAEYQDNGGSACLQSFFMPSVRSLALAMKSFLTSLESGYYSDSCRNVNIFGQRFWPAFHAAEKGVELSTTRKAANDKTMRAEWKKQSVL
jgi:hypothetical protein